MKNSIASDLGKMFPKLLVINLISTIIAAFMGQKILKQGRLQHFNQYLFKFAYNIKEGIVTV